MEFGNILKQNTIFKLSVILRGSHTINNLISTSKNTAMQRYKTSKKKKLVKYKSSLEKFPTWYITQSVI